MFRTNGQNFSYTTLTRGTNLQYIQSESYGSRTVIGVNDSASSAEGYWDFVARFLGSCDASTDNNPYAFVFRARVAFETLSLSVGQSSTIAILFYARHDGNNANYLHIKVKNDSGTYKITVTTSAGVGGNTITLGTVEAGTTFYTIEIHFLLDKIHGYFDEDYIDEADNANTYSSNIIYSLILDWDNTASVDTKWDNLYLDKEPVDYSTDVNSAYANNAPANATAWYIKKAYLDDGVVSGDVFEVDCVDGYQNSGLVTDAGDYLFTMTLDDNDGGYATKMSLGSGGDFTLGW